MLSGSKIFLSDEIKSSLADVLEDVVAVILDRCIGIGCNKRHTHA